MNSPFSSETEKDFVQEIRNIEEDIFSDHIDDRCESTMRDGTSLEYIYFRPSHHFATGLLRKSDIEYLTASPDRKLLSIGSGPGYLERLLIELGVSPDNIVLLDKNFNDLNVDLVKHTITSDLHDEWPKLDKFDRIIFPESLGVSLLSKVGMSGSISDVLLVPLNSQYSVVSSSDDKTISLITNCLRQSLLHLENNGIIRANGAIDQLHIIGAAMMNLQDEGFVFDIAADNELLELQNTETSVVNEILKAFGSAYRHRFGKV